MLTMLGRAAYLSKTELAQATGVSEALVRQYTKDGTIPEHLYHRGDDREYRYALVAVAVIELMAELGEFFGSNSPLPKLIVRQAVPKLEMAWQEAEPPAATMKLTQGALEIRAPLACLSRAKGKLAALAAA